MRMKILRKTTKTWMSSKTMMLMQMEASIKSFSRTIRRTKICLKIPTFLIRAKVSNQRWKPLNPM